MGPILQSYLLGEFLSDEICLNLSCLRKSLFLGAHDTNDASVFLGNFSPLQFVSVELLGKLPFPGAYDTKIASTQTLAKEQDRHIAKLC
jgi:hypothetical protein